MAVCTWDPVKKSKNATLSDNNLTAFMLNLSSPVFGTLGHSEGKRYFEVAYIQGNFLMVGIANEEAKPDTSFRGSDKRLYFGFNKWLYPGETSYGEKFTIGDCIGVAVNMDSGLLEFFKNGVSQGVAFSDLKNMGVRIFPYAVNGGGSGGDTVTANFGATPFQYPIPEGYLSWNDDDPTDPTDPADPELHILLEVGEQIQLIGNTLPENIGDPNLEWNSTLPNIASVDSTGLVTAIAEGVTCIQVKTIDGTWTDYALVEVVANEEGEDDEYRLSILLKVGESCLLKFAESEDVIWQSSDPAVATVEPSDAPITRVTALAEGLSLVTVQTADGSKQDQIYVTVIE